MARHCNAHVAHAQACITCSAVQLPATLQLHECAAILSCADQAARCAGEGLDAAGHAMLQAKLGADERGSTLLPFVQPSAHDPRLAEPENRHTLQCLASSAPVSQFLRPQAAPIVRRLLQVRCYCSLPAACHQAVLSWL